jgi:hypothetical protein
MRRVLIILTITLTFASASAGAGEQQFKASVVSPNCTDSARQVVPMCAPEGQTIKQTMPTVSSRAGNSSYTIGSDPAHPNCMILTVIAAPNGEDCLSVLGQKICNCKGRGWIDIEVNVIY